MITVTEKLSFAEVAEWERSGGEVKDIIRLPFDERKRGRLKTETESGQAVGIFVERGDVMRDGTLLRAESGAVYRVKSADEEVTTASTEDSHLFARACYHLGNRHVPLQVGEGWLRYQNDYVLDDMLRQLGLIVIQEQAPFEPENGAYGEHGGHSHGGHSHHHDELDDLSHGHAHHHHN